MLRYTGAADGGGGSSVLLLVVSLADDEEDQDAGSTRMAPGRREFGADLAWSSELRLLLQLDLKQNPIRSSQHHHHSPTGQGRTAGETGKETTGRRRRQRD